MAKIFDVIIVGAGASGVGMGVALQQIGMTSEDYLIVEKHSVGESFKRWPAEMRFISPSFNSNPFGLVDLNAITPNTSPAFTLRKEHPSGQDYARYLRAVAEHFELPVQSGVDVKSMTRDGDGFALDTNKGEMRARFVIWAAGEFQYPKLNGFAGGDLCMHNATIRSWEEMKGKEFVVIGGYESGIDAAVHLSALGKKVRVIDSREAWQDENSDPSISLSPFTYQRLQRELQNGRITLIGGKRVTEVARHGRGFSIRTDDDEYITSNTAPILATGFKGGAHLIREHFEWRDDGQPQVNELDESTSSPGLFLVGPSLRHKRFIFCFIYKFRQRFAVVANAIGTRLGMDTAALDVYRKAEMFLDDLSCCGDECAC